MKNKLQMTEYLGSLLQQQELDPKIVAEIDNALLLLVVYYHGIQGLNFPLEKLFNVEVGNIPEPFVTTAAQLAALKGGVKENAFEYMMKNVKEHLKDFKRFFTSQQTKG